MPVPNQKGTEVPTNFQISIQNNPHSLLLSSGLITNGEWEHINIEHLEYDGTHTVIIDGFPVLNWHNFTGHGESVASATANALKAFALYLTEMAESFSLPQED